MKTFLTLSLHLLITSFLFAQAPQGIPYQAVMRNVDGSVMASSAVNLIFMIHDGSATGTVVYQESQALTSSAQGLVSCVVGSGVVSQGNFANINWGDGAKFLQVMMGSTDLGTQQMMSVPYALFSEATNVSVSATGDTLTVGGNRVIVPGISAANLPALYTMGSGLTDIDGNVYPSIVINGQEWMQQNLAVTKYRNGDPIPTGLSNTTWQSTTSGAYAIYNNDAANNTTYGKLYNWYAVNDSRGLCPTGWHVPSDPEWTTLINYLDPNQNPSLFGIQSSVAGGKMKSTGIIGNVVGLENIVGLWNYPNEQATNESGFSGFPSGSRDYDGTYSFVGLDGYWWSGTEVDSNHAWLRTLYHNSSYVYRYYYVKLLGFSVRCVRD
jgi:uncharacterized protein (TIGR02145 family)